MKAYPLSFDSTSGILLLLMLLKLADRAADDLHLGKINDQQQGAWRKTPEVFDEDEREDPNPQPVPRRPGSATRRAGQYPGEAEWVGTASPADLRRLLAGVRVVASSRAISNWFCRYEWHVYECIKFCGGYTLVTATLRNRSVLFST